MSRFLLFVVILGCIFYGLQANPVPDDTEQTVSSTLDQVTALAKKMLNDARVDLNDAMEKAKTYLNQARENINKDLKNLNVES